MAIGIYFDGRRLIRPQAATKIDDTGMFARGLGGGNTLALIGESTGGEPQKVIYFTDPSFAKAVLRSGPLLTAIQRAYDPSSEVSGAYLVAAIRANRAEQASLTLKDTNGVNTMTLTSIDYGIWNNQIKARVESGTTVGKKVTVTVGTAFDQGDNIAKSSFFIGLSDAKVRIDLSTMAISIGATKLLTTAIVANAQKIYYSIVGDTDPAPTDLTVPLAEDDTNYGTVELNTAKYLYIGSDIPFNALQYGLGGGVANLLAATLIVEYWTGTGWTVAPNLVDLTQSPSGTTLGTSGTVTFYGTAGDSYTYPTGWVKSLPGAGFVFTGYWLRLRASTGLTPAATGDWIWLNRNRKLILTDYPTIQQLVDYIDAQPGYEAGIVTGSPDTDLSTQLDDVTSVRIVPATAGSTTITPTPYDPVTSGRVIVVAATTNFAIGDYITISRVDGTSEETRKITSIGTLTLTVDSALSTTYSTGSVIRECKTLNSDLQALIDWFNGGNTAYASAAYVSTTTRGTINNNPDTYFTGATEYGSTGGVPYPGIRQTDWDDAIDLLKTEDIQLISTVSVDPSVWASLSTHCSYTSGVGRSERIGFVGGFGTDGGYIAGLGKWGNTTDQNNSIAYMISQAQGLNSDRMVYVGPGVKAYDENGVLTTYNGAYAAALVAGMFAGSDVATAMTHKTIKVFGLEYNLRWADLEALLTAGVLPLEYDPGRAFRVCQSITTWLRNDKYNRREVSVRRTADFVARQVRDRLDRDFVGTKGTKTTLISIKNATISVLTQMARAELLAGDEANPPFKNIQCRLEGDTCWVDFEASPVIPINYIPVTIHLTVFTSTVTG